MRKSFLAGIIFFLFTSLIFSQINLKGNLESGFFKSSGDLLNSENDLMIAFEGKLGYKYKQEHTEFSAELKIRPEIYAIEKELSTLIFKAGGNFFRREENFDWGISAGGQINKISGNNINIDYDLFSIEGNSIFYWFEDTPVLLLAGYAYQKIESATEQSNDIIYFEGKANTNFGTYFKAGYGLYAEKFTIEGETIENFITSKEKIPGYKVGPSIEIFYMKDFVLNAQYKFLFHQSDRIKFPSYEQRIRMITGKILFDDFSIFLLVDYNLRSIKRKDVDEQINILYSPFNLENQVSLKFGYELSENAEVYLKGSYFHNDLVYNNYMFEGWNLLLGIELSK